MGAEYSRAQCAELIREVIGYLRVYDLNHYGLKMENAPCELSEAIPRIIDLFAKRIESFEDEHLSMSCTLLRCASPIKHLIGENFNRLYDLALQRELVAGSRLLIGLSRVQ